MPSLLWILLLNGLFAVMRIHKDADTVRKIGSAIIGCLLIRICSFFPGVTLKYWMQISDVYPLLEMVPVPVPSEILVSDLDKDPDPDLLQMEIRFRMRFKMS